jgi:hypothetical protein
VKPNETTILVTLVQPAWLLNLQIFCKKGNIALIFQSCLIIEQTSFIVSMIQISVLPDNLDEGLDLIPHILIEAM